MAFVILIGASGSGKTAIASTITSHYSRDVRVFHFDHIGVPSAQQMIAEYGSGEAWQRAKTLEWIVKLASVVTATSGVLFEGQTRPSFLAEAAAAIGNIKYTLILIDCDEDCVLLKVEQVGGIACHKGYPSCFFRRLEGDDWRVVLEKPRGIGA